MNLLTKAILDKVPGMYETEDLPDDKKKVWAKFFNPCGAGTWYLCELDKETGDAFGFAHIHEFEAGYFSLTELEKIRTRFGLGIERDIHFKPMTVAKLLELKAEGKHV